MNNAKDMIVILDESIKNNFSRLKSISSQLIDIVNRTAIKNKLTDYQLLSLILESPCWPQYTFNDQLPVQYILDNFLLPINNNKVLLYGTTSEEFIEQSLKRNVYKIINYNNIIIRQDHIYTDNWEYVVNNQPYDAVLLWDILDHDDNPVETLKKISKILAKNGKIYVHCHPWCSRNGSHANTNKAYTHLIFSPDELKQLKINTRVTNKILDPQNDYEKWFRSAELYVLRKGNTIKEPVDNFFYIVPLLLKKISNHWCSSSNKKIRMGMEKLPLEIQSIEYVLV